MSAPVRIRLVCGQWYAFGRGQKKQQNLLLVPAIAFCRRLNEGKKGRST